MLVPVQVLDAGASQSANAGFSQSADTSAGAGINAGSSTSAGSSVGTGFSAGTSARPSTATDAPRAPPIASNRTVTHDVRRSVPD